MNETHGTEQEFEIDLVGLLLKLKSLWYLLVIGCLIGAIVSTLYVTFLKTPMYQSSSQLYLRGDSQTISLQDLQLGSELSKDYEVLFKRRSNIENVIDELSLDYSVGELKSMIKISSISNTRILQVSVVADDYNVARDICNAVVEQGMNDVREIDSQEPYLVEKAIANKNPIGRSTRNTVIMGAMIGLLVSIVLISLKTILSDKITSIDDVESAVGLPVLAVVLEDKNLTYAKRKTSKKQRR